jgi:hypothetical protein
MKTQTKKIEIVREVIDIINECEANGDAYNISMKACMYLKDEYDYDRANATQLLVGAELINELGLL